MSRQHGLSPRQQLLGGVDRRVGHDATFAATFAATFIVVAVLTGAGRDVEKVQLDAARHESNHAKNTNHKKTHIDVIKTVVTHSDISAPCPGVTVLKLSQFEIAITGLALAFILH